MEKQSLNYIYYFFTFLAVFGISAAQSCPSSVSNSTGLLSVYNGRCYHFVQTDLTWNQARSDCQSRSGALASIPSQETQTYLFNRAMALSDDGITSKNDYWLGGQLASDGNSHTWGSGESSTYTNWNAGHPNSTNGACLYMSLIQNGQWRTAQCDNVVWMYGYICSYQLSGANKGPSTSMIALVLAATLIKYLKDL